MNGLAAFTLDAQDVELDFETVIRLMFAAAIESL